MRILFIYIDNTTAVGYSAGIGILSAVLRLAKHETKLLHVSEELGYPFDMSRIEQDIIDYDPGLICFSITTNHWSSTCEVGRFIKKAFAVPILVGGPHVTADPEGTMDQPWVDFGCRGEGELLLPELVRRLEGELPLDGVPNLLHRASGRVIREPMGMFVEHLDSLPFDDREIFDYPAIISSRSGWAEVIVTRGCPYPCSYCFNKPLLDAYAGEVGDGSFKRKKFVRRRSVDSTISMLREIRSRYSGIGGFTFVDDILAMDTGWFGEFSTRYPEEIALPYACTSHPLLFNRELAQQLRKSGCKVVKMGLESGNAENRRRVLARDITDQRLIDIFGLAKEYGLKPQAFNMIGLPGETVDQMMDTVRLNAVIKPYIVWVSTFIPYPGTPLYHFCRENGFIDDSRWGSVDSYRGNSPLAENVLPALPFMKFRQLFRWHLNAALGNGARKLYEEQISDLSSFPDKAWLDGTVEREFLLRDAEIDGILKERDISHYVSKKYINIFWGREYDYDLT